MGGNFKIGDVVEHKEYGKGIIRPSNYGRSYFEGESYQVSQYRGVWNVEFFTSGAIFLMNEKQLGHYPLEGEIKLANIYQVIPTPSLDIGFSKVIALRLYERADLPNYVDIDSWEDGEGREISDWIEFIAFDEGIESPPLLKTIIPLHEFRRSIRILEGKSYTVDQFIVNLRFQYNDLYDPETDKDGSYLCNYVYLDFRLWDTLILENRVVSFEHLGITEEEVNSPEGVDCDRVIPILIADCIESGWVIKEGDKYYLNVNEYEEFDTY